MSNDITDLLSLYGEYKKCSENIRAFKEQIESLNSDLSVNEDMMSYFNYKDVGVIAKTIDTYIDKVTSEKESETRQALESQIRYLHKYDETLRKNYRKLSSWYIGKKRPDKVIKGSRPYIYSSETDKKISNYPFLFSGESGWILGAPVLFILFGPVYLAYKLTKMLLDAILGIGIIDVIISVLVSFLVLSLWFSLVGVGLDYLFRNLSLSLLISILVVLFMGCAYTLFQLVFSHVALKHDAEKYLAVYYPDLYRENGCVSIMNNFKMMTDKWRSDIDKYNAGENPQFASEFIGRIKQDYERYQEEVNKTTQAILLKEQDIKEEEARLGSLDKQIDEVREKVAKPITDIHYNNCVLTDYVCLKKDNYSVISHNNRPMLWVYDSVDIDNIQRQIAVFISDLYAGLVCANHFSVIDYCLIDFETGGGLLSHDNDARRLLDLNLLSVISNSRSRDEFNKALNNQKNRIIGAGGSGDISIVNPIRIKDNDMPFKYHIVIHYGKEARSVSGDLVQLYSSSSKFGFLPIFVMSKEEADEFISDGGVLSSIFTKENIFKITY